MRFSRRTAAGCIAGRLLAVAAPCGAAAVAERHGDCMQLEVGEAQLSAKRAAAHLGEAQERRQSARRPADSRWTAGELRVLERALGGAKVCGEPSLLGSGADAIVWRLDLSCDSDCAAGASPVALKDFGRDASYFTAEAEARALRYLSPSPDIIELRAKLPGEVGGVPTLIEELATTTLWQWIYVDRRLRELQAVGRAREWPVAEQPRIEATHFCSFERLDEASALLEGAETAERREGGFVQVAPGQRGRLLRVSAEGEGVGRMDGADTDVILTPGGLSCFSMGVSWGRDARQQYAQEAMVIFGQLLRGLAHLAQKKVAHRDLKPDNVLLLCGDGGHECRAKISDFGFACWLGRGPGTASRPPPHWCGDLAAGISAFAGTHTYIAPEIYHDQGWEDIAKHDDVAEERLKSDVWSVGMMLWELFNGDLPRSMREWRRAFDAEMVSKEDVGGERFSMAMAEFVGAEGKQHARFDPAHDLGDIDELRASLDGVEFLQPATQDILRLMVWMLQRKVRRRCTAAEAWAEARHILKALNVDISGEPPASPQVDCLLSGPRARYTPRAATD
mmetsp:Transcript_68078/g.197262  ORF Transcript_68078/g.197262 Transcript_68078/m.197262 type:complete len:564 (+) Transcript_68078:54-1745(+)